MTNLEAICICRQCNWGQKRGDYTEVIGMAHKHLETGHDVDIRLYNESVETPIEGPEDKGRLDYLERTGETK